MAMLMMTMFIGLPLLWTGMMSWIGISMGNQLSHVLDNASATANKAQKSSTGGR
jgi:hypothetical protein